MGEEGSVVREEERFNRAEGLSVNVGVHSIAPSALPQESRMGKLEENTPSNQIHVKVPRNIRPQNLLRQLIIRLQEPRKVLLDNHAIGLVVPEHVLPVRILDAHGFHPDLGALGHVAAGREPCLMDELGEGFEVVRDGTGQEVARRERSGELRALVTIVERIDDGGEEKRAKLVDHD